MNIACQILRRSFHSTHIRYASDSPLYRLRKKTGLAYSLCRQALDKYSNNVDEAEAWLNAQSLALGLQKASKLVDRSAKEGLIGVGLDRANNSVTLVELNCETDFVAKNDLFKESAISLTREATLLKSSVIGKQSSELVEVSRVPEDQIKTMDNLIAPLIGKLGEKIRIRRIEKFKCLSSNSFIFGDVHAQTGSQEDSGLLVKAGRFGSMIALESSDANPDQLSRYGSLLCKHIIGYSPTYIELPDNVRKHLVEAKAEQKERLAEQAAGSDVQEGERGEEDSDLESTEADEPDWPSLMDQKLMASDDVTVRDFCKEKGLKVLHFRRVECGEDLVD